MSDPLLSGKRCLVLDDEFLIALDIQQILELAGAAHVACAATATEAIETLRRQPKFDFAVLDVKLSGPVPNSLGVAALLAEKETLFVFLRASMTCLPVNSLERQSLKNLTTRRCCWTPYAVRLGPPDRPRTGPSGSEGYPRGHRPVPPAF